MRFCLIQAELDQAKHEWNCHYIRKSGFDTPQGIPNTLFYLHDSELVIIIN